MKTSASEVSAEADAREARVKADRPAVANEETTADLPKAWATAGWRRLLSAAGHSFDGLGAAWRLEAAFRQEVLLAALLLPLALWLPVSRVESLLLALSVLGVLAVELLNSAIEAVVDRVSGDYHALSKRAKDIGSAAVLVALAMAALTWFVILWPLLKSAA